MEPTFVPIGALATIMDFTWTMGKLKNIASNARTTGSFLVMTRKLLSRFEPNTRGASLEWIGEQYVFSTEQFCRTRDVDLWEEAEQEARKIDGLASATLSGLSISLGGGGNYILGYFYARFLRPEVIFETGVAAGWTSVALLRAIRRNGFGLLFSSDFPYFRLEEPEKYVGILAKGEDISRWKLDLRGDKVALRDFTSALAGEKISLIHYDSDKSVRGRREAVRELLPHVSDKCVLIMDDVQDNLFFRNLVNHYSLEYSIIEFLGKYLGVVENFGSQMAAGGFAGAKNPLRTSG